MAGSRTYDGRCRLDGVHEEGDKKKDIGKQPPEKMSLSDALFRAVGGPLYRDVV